MLLKLTSLAILFSLAYIYTGCKRPDLPANQPISTELGPTSDTITSIKVGLIDLSERVDTWDVYRLLNDFAKNDEIKALLLRLQTNVDSYGLGYAFFNEFKKFGQEKLVVALIEDSCLETCYYIALGASYIVASPTAAIGLIGIQMNIPRYNNVKINSEKRTADLHLNVLYKGSYKSMLDPHGPELTTAQKDHLETMMQDFYDQFCQDAAERRNLSLDSREHWANGKHFSGRRAVQKDLNLVDVIGSYSDALELIKKHVFEKEGIDGEIVLIKDL